ncbi:putative oxidoreductase [Teratosphaeria nubilosa]|uniref:Putative oxidoreductase n=1 Tax=Teratosphaeria nubilosa TaxID=161662 RepID=A0A6G1L0I8_9PEZI|nr:putative oxidoreductase [Teratosphaeria nubilosa]
MADRAPLPQTPSTFTNASDTVSTVILGAGIIGCSTAYYLAHSGNTKPDTIHLIESSPELFASASGKSGGFLAADWFGPASADLGELSFRLHKELAEEHDGRHNWGYSRSTGISLVEGLPSRKQKGSKNGGWMSEGGSRAEAAGMHEFQGPKVGPAWLKRRNGDKVDIISEAESTAQVDPLRLSQWLLKTSQEKGVHLHQPARAVRLCGDSETGNLGNILIRHDNSEEYTIPCTRLVVAAGAWSAQVYFQLFPSSSLKLGISQLAGHSVVVRSPRWKQEMEDKDGCHAIFTSMHSGFSPEVFSRIGEEIYIAGLNDPALPLPETPGDAHIDQQSIVQLTAIAHKLLGPDAADEMPSDIEVVREGLCFRPVTRRGVPILAQVPDESLGDGLRTKERPYGGVFVAAGHGPWGISLSLGSGKVMQEMAEGVNMSADVSGLGPEEV